MLTRLKLFWSIINPLNLYKFKRRMSVAKDMSPDPVELRKLRHTKDNFEQIYQNSWRRYAAGRVKNLPTMTLIEVKKAFAAGWGYADETFAQELRPDVDSAQKTR